MSSTKRKLHETDDEEETSTDAHQIQPKKKKVYQQIFLREYQTKFTELRSSWKGPSYAHCTICKSDFSVAHGGQNDCKKHYETKAHKSSKEALSQSTTLTSFCQRLNSKSHFQDQVTRAEALMCSLIPELNLSLSAADTLSKAFVKMFPDSKIAANIKCGRNKATAMILEMSAMTMNKLAIRMQRLPFSIATDGSNDSDKKQFPLVVTIEGEDGLVNSHLLALPVCKESSATGQNIFKTMADELHSQGISWVNCIAFGCDNANVMTGQYNGVYSFIKREQDSIYLARCCLHLVHLAAKKGASCLPPVEEVLVDIFYFFKKSVKRQSELKNLQVLYDAEQMKIIKHVCTRWLSIARCLKRLIENWDPLMHFFHEEKYKNSKPNKKPNDVQTTAELEGHCTTYSVKKVDAIYEFLRSPTNRLFCHFLSYTLKVYDQVLVQLQAEKPMIHTLKENLYSLIGDLYSRFLLPTAVNGIDIDKVQYKLRSSQKDDADLFIGSQAKTMLENKEKYSLRDKRIVEFYASVRKYFEMVLDYLLKKLPLADPVLQNASVVDPKRRLEVKQHQLEYFLTRFPVLIPSGTDVDTIYEEFARYQQMNIDDCDEDGVRVDRIWQTISQKHPSLKNLAHVVKGILTIPHSSAACERIFSMVRKTCTDQRTTLAQETTEALLVLKGKSGSCLDVDEKFSAKELQQLKSSYYNSLKKYE